MVYSDSDDGRAQESLLATSHLAFKSWPSLGRRKTISPKQAVCEVRKGRLEPRITRTFSREEPVITMP